MHSLLDAQRLVLGQRLSRRGDQAVFLSYLESHSTLIKQIEKKIAISEAHGYDDGYSRL
jgi:hypothetical protein